MSRLESVKDSSLNLFPLSSPTSRKALSIFAQLLSSCAGPFGRNHIVRNACGGHMTITSCCSRILSATSISRSELKLVVSAISAHLQQCGDAGLFMAHVCLQLTKASLDTDIHHNIFSSVFSSFLSIISGYIKSDDTTISVKADFSNVQVLLAYVRSILKSKSLLSIQLQVINDLSLLILNSFVLTIPSNALRRLSGGVFLVGVEKQPISSSKCVDGIMLEAPELLSCEEFSSLCQSKSRQSVVKVALITQSMSGDVDEAVTNATFEGTEQQVTSMEQCVFQQMVSLCDLLEQENIGVVLCQKVIHPRVKMLLKSKGMIYLDRLGLQPVAFIRDLTGCRPISSVLLPPNAVMECFGTLTSVTICIENNKQYIHLENSESPTNVVTLVLCAEVEERLSELKHCVTSCLQGLSLLGKEPWLLKGGGCWQMHCSYVLKEKVLSSLTEISEQHSCSEASVRQLLSIFRSCLHRWCVCLKQHKEHISFDPSSMHCWTTSKPISALLLAQNEARQTCQCGFKSLPIKQLQNMDIVLSQDDTLYDKATSVGLDLDVQDSDNYNDVVLDSMTACLEALQKGVLTAGLLLSIGQFICDQN